MSQGWKDTQNFQFGRPPRKPPPPNPPSLWLRALELVRSAHPSISLHSDPPFPYALEWSSIPPSADPSGGKLEAGRASKKRHQVGNMIAAVNLCLSRFPSFSPPHVVEFCAR